MSQRHKRLGRFLVKLEHIRLRFINHRNFIIAISFIIGVVSALAAVLLKMSVQFVEHEVSTLNDSMHSSWSTVFFPLIGTGLSLLLLKRLFKGRLQRGVGFIVNSIFINKGRIPKQHIFGHILTGAITVAFGGSVGLEAPIVATGAAIGSSAGKDMRLSSKDTILLLACGTASGIAAIFNSPIAGIIFALEVLMLDFSIPFFIPLLISTATATVISQVMYPDKFVFMVIHGWNLNALPFYIVLGIMCGMVSVYTTQVVENVEGYFHKKDLGWRVWLMAGLPLCLLIFIFPGLYGEGYHIITNLLHDHYTILPEHTFLSNVGSKPYAIIIMCVLLIGLKSFTAALTVSAGGNGGIFAPSLIIGGLTGFLFAYVLNLSGMVHLRTANFIIAAMAGVLAGVMHAPLTAIFLLAEITGGYVLFIPLMIVSAMSYFITGKYVKHSIYHKAVIQQNILNPDGLD